MRVLIVDDEPLNRLRIEDLLRGEASVSEILTAENGDDAIATIRDAHPDLVFLDVQMPGRTGLDVVRTIGADAMPATIFVTAFDQYAVEAFNVAAVDYLVKPFDDERFEEAFRRAQKSLAAKDATRLRDEMLSLLNAHDRPAQPDGARSAAATSTSQSQLPLPSHPSALAGSPYLERFAVEHRGAVRPVLAKDVDYITAAGPYAELHVGGRKLLIRETMNTLEQRLDPDEFMRVHRSIIVRLALVDALEREAGGDGVLVLKGGAKLRVSRTRRDALEKWMGLA